MEKKQLIYISLGVGVLTIMIVGFILYRKNEQYTSPSTPVGSFRVDNNGNLSITPGLPIGSIVMWNSKNPPPTGWVICDGTIYGTHVTPDLRGRFPKGVTEPTGLASNFGETGGSTTTKILPQNLPAHIHNVLIGSSSATVTGGGNNTFRVGQGVDFVNYNETDGGIGLSNPPTAGISIVPPYYAISFIMKIK